MSRSALTKILGQIIAYAGFIGLIGFFSNQPAYRHLAVDAATIKLSLRHAGQILGECRERSSEEMAQLPENMRVVLVCPRERSPLELELTLNGKLQYSAVLQARGLHEDGRASVYQRLTVPAGPTEVTVRLKDHIESEEFHYVASRRLSLPVGANLVIDFDEQARDFEFLLAGVVLPESAEAGSEERTALQNPLDYFETRHGERQDHQEKNNTAVRQRLAATLFDHAQNPVGQEVQTSGNQGE